MKKILSITMIFLFVMIGMLAIAVTAQGVTGQAGLASGLETTSTGTLDNIGVAGLAIGVGEPDQHGGVHVLHATTSGPSAAGGQYWNQDHPEVAGAAEPGESFGYAVMWGDFDGNDLPDLAIGTPYDKISGVATGSVTVLYGTSAGISAAGSQYFSPEIIPDFEPELYDLFGEVMAAGDFDNDGYDDLVIGVPNEDSGEIDNAGRIHVLYGSPGGLDIASAQSFDQGTPDVYGNPEENDRFGWSLAVGKFDGDDYDDLAVGVPREDIGSIQDAGHINLLYGSSAGLEGRDTYFNQDNAFACCVAEEDDLFGSALAAGDFDNDGWDDLAIGVPREDSGEIMNAGLVNLLYGSEDGLVDRNALFSQDMLPGCSSEIGDSFGESLAAGDLNGDGHDDLVIGVPNEDSGELMNAGGINVLYGEDSGLTIGGAQWFDQDSPGVYGINEQGDYFGDRLAVGDLNGDGNDDLAVGVSWEDIGTMAFVGIVHILSGAEGGLEGNDQWITQEMTGLGEAEAEDRFGWSLAIWPFPFPYTPTINLNYLPLMLK